MDDQVTPRLYRSPPTNAPPTSRTRRPAAPPTNFPAVLPEPERLAPSGFFVHPCAVFRDVSRSRAMLAQFGYPLIRASAGIIPTGIAVQEGNYAHVNPRTRKPVSIQELIVFATEQLKVDYLFWCVEEPFYSRNLILFLQAQR